MQAFKQTGKWYEELDTPPIPLEILQEWQWFLALSSRRPQGYSGVCAIPYSEFLAWMKFSGNNPTQMQKMLLGDIDMIYMGLVDEQMAKD